MPSLSAVASFSAACRSLSSSAEAIRDAADDHLGLGPDIDWSTAEYAVRLARTLEDLTAEVQSFGGVR